MCRVPDPRPARGRRRERRRSRSAAPKQRALARASCCSTPARSSRPTGSSTSSGASNPPRTATTSLQNLVSQLRKLLPAGRARDDSRPATCSRSSEHELDLRPLRAAGRGGAAGEGARARPQLLRDALALWRGPPLADLTFETFAQGEIGRLDELRLQALEERIDADLELGRGGELVGELEGLVARAPAARAPARAADARALPLGAAGGGARGVPRRAPRARRRARDRARARRSSGSTGRSCGRRRRSSVRPRRTSVDDQLDDVVGAALAGRLVLVARRRRRPRGARDGDGLPGPAEVAAHLGQALRLPAGACPRPRARRPVRRAHEGRRARSTTSCTTLFDREYAPGRGARGARASSAGLLRDARRAAPLLVTTSFDEPLEQALRAAGRGRRRRLLPRARPPPREVPPRRRRRRRRSSSTCRTRTRTLSLERRTRRPQDPRRRRPRPGAGVGELRGQRGRLHRLPRPDRGRRRRPGHARRAAAAEPLPLPRLPAPGLEPARVPAPRLGARRSATAPGPSSRSRTRSSASSGASAGSTSSTCRSTSTSQRLAAPARGRGPADERRRPLSPYKGLAPFEDSELDVRVLLRPRARARADRGEPDGVAPDRPLRRERRRARAPCCAPGVAHHSGVAAANLEARGEPGLAVVVFDAWRDDPVRRSAPRSRDAVTRALGGSSAARRGRARSPDAFGCGSSSLGGELYVVLDQIEEYFLYHGARTARARSPTSSPTVVTAPELRVNFLLAIREDALAKLDASRPDPGPPRQLPAPRAPRPERRPSRDRRADRRATTGSSRPTSAVDDRAGARRRGARQVAGGRVDVGPAGAGPSQPASGDRAHRGAVPPARPGADLGRGAAAGSRCCVWRRSNGWAVPSRSSASMSSARSNALDRAREGRRRADLRPPRHAVRHEDRPRGGDLAAYAGVRESGASCRCSPSSATSASSARSRGDGARRAYEIFHDVLAEPVLAWKGRYEQMRALETPARWPAHGTAGSWSSRPRRCSRSWSWPASPSSRFSEQSHAAARRSARPSRVSSPRAR